MDGEGCCEGKDAVSVEGEVVRTLLVVIAINLVVTHMDVEQVAQSQ